jgi:serine/threonine protein kinase
MTRKKFVSWEERYRKCDEQLGCGGNAKVYKAFRLSDNNQVALKELENRTPEKKERFIQEIEIMKSITN